MQINKQLFEDVLSGKMKGTFMLRNGNKINTSDIKRNVNGCYDIYPYRTKNCPYTANGFVYENSISDYDIIDFIPESYMKEIELKIDIPEGYEIDKEKSNFEKIIFKEKCTYPKSWEEFCINNKTKDKEYFISSGSKVFNTCHVQDRDYDEDRNVCKTKEEAEAFLALIQLKRLWHEYVDNYSGKVVDYYFIDCVSNINGCEFIVLPSCSVISKYLFKFPSRELAQEFLHNFKDLFIKIYHLWS